jgi:hypothetical protein
MTPTAPSSRRALLTAAGALLAAGCGSASTPHAKKGTSIAHADIKLLNRLIDLENYATAAYTAAVPLLPPSSVPAAKRFLGQEIDHASGLGALVAEAGGKPIKPRPGYDLGHPHSSQDVMELLRGVEDVLLTAYLDAIPRLTPGPVRAMAAAFFANDAQHASIWRVALGQPPVPAAFVTGGE